VFSDENNDNRSSVALKDEIPFELDVIIPATIFFLPIPGTESSRQAVNT
jgi:hypothetical protein